MDKEKQELVKEIKLRFCLCRDPVTQQNSGGSRDYNEGAVDGMMKVLACYDRELFFELFPAWVQARRSREDKDYPDYYACPVCGESATGCRNIYKAHWYYCSRCLVTWCEGVNLLSSWTMETPEDWERNKRFLRKFRVVEP